MLTNLLSIDWITYLVGEEDWVFLAEIAVRTIIMYIIILFGLRLLGKRGVRQLSVFELVVIISLGSAAGDPMFYKEVGLLIPVVIFSIIVASYRFTTYLTSKSSKIDELIEGKCSYLIRDGKFSINNFNKEALAYDEFFSELRQYSISHLGQVDAAILETSGNLSIYYYPDEKVRYGLPILPDLFDKAQKEITQKDLYSCTFCGNVEEIGPTEEYQCNNCGRTKWVKAINNKRIK